MYRVSLIAAAAAICVAVPARSQMITRTVVVEYRDLDLRRHKDVSKLDRRIARAAVEVCGPTSSWDLEGTNDKTRCVRNTILAAGPMRARLIPTGVATAK